jgi:CheY-like chemotaxis protein
MDTKTSSVQDSQRAEKDTAVPLGKHIVLYIEDNSTIRQLLRHIIDLRPGVILLEAENGAQGLAMALSRKPDLILLDIHLPDMNGFKVFEHLQKNPDTANIPVVAMSGSASPSDIEKGLRAGFRQFLPKPIDIKGFLGTLDSILAP